MSSDQGNGNGLKRRDLLLSGSSLLAASGLAQTGLTRSAQAQQPASGQPVGGRPNILVIFGDDIGQTNVSAYSMGLMGYRTPNIDRIAEEGMIFTDYYAEQSCTPVVRLSSPARRHCAPGCRRSACRAPRLDCRRRTRQSPSC